MLRRSLFLLSLAFVSSFCLWLINTSTHPSLPKKAEAPRFYSNQSQQDLRLTFIEAIKSAQKSITLSVFGLNDPATLITLKEQIQAGIETSIYYDPTASTHELHQLLKGAHIEGVQQGGLMHQKILILDDERIFIGSANLTTSSLCMHDNLVIGFCNKEMAHFLKTHIPYESGSFRTRIGSQEIAVWLLPDVRGHALEQLRNRIHLASRSIKVALFTLTHPLLIDDLIQAKKRGVDVSCAIDVHSGCGCGAKAIRQLKEAGVKIFFSQGIQLLHHKFLIVDDRTIVLGSANWTKAAFTKNSDALLLLDPMTENQKRFMKRLWYRIQCEGRQK